MTAKPIVNCLMFRAELQIRLNSANLPLVGGYPVSGLDPDSGEKTQ
jgi:hypothetical protein